MNKKPIALIIALIMGIIVIAAMIVLNNRIGKGEYSVRYLSDVSCEASSTKESCQDTSDKVKIATLDHKTHEYRACEWNDEKHLCQPTKKTLSAQEQRDEALIIAASLGNVQEVATLLNEGADINASVFFTPLTIAALNKHNEVIEALLAHSDIDVNKPSQEGDTAVMMAVRIQNKQGLDLLLKAPHIKVMQANKKGKTPLMIAAYLGSVDMVTTLLAHDTSAINAEDAQGNNALCDAVMPVGEMNAFYKENMFAIVQMLIKAGAQDPQHKALNIVQAIINPAHQDAHNPVLDVAQQVHTFSSRVTDQYQEVFSLLQTIQKK